MLHNCYARCHAVCYTETQTPLEDSVSTTYWFCPKEETWLQYDNWVRGKPDPEALDCSDCGTPMIQRTKRQNAKRIRPGAEGVRDYVRALVCGQ
jgi:hypothetical protein